MGGGDLNVPKEIWSPAGGFYADPKKWRRNTVIVAGLIAATAYLAFRKGVELEERHCMPSRPIPSQRWAPNSFPRE